VTASVLDQNNTQVLVDSSHVLDLDGNVLKWQTWELSADMQFVLFKTDHLKQWRHSSFGNYWIHRLSDRSTFPVIEPTYPPTITHCTWSPVSHSLAYTNKNDLYVIPDSEMAQGTPKAIRVTTDGSAVIFNGVPDWAYEEEVFSSDSALWWSPNGKTVAYLRSDEAEVKDYKLQYYNPSNDAFTPNQYLTELDMK
jgi:dipeptidyl aminopeptidase